MKNDYERVARVVDRARVTRLTTTDVAAVARRARLPGRGWPEVLVKLGTVPADGSGWELRAGFAATPFGRCLFGVAKGGLCALTYPRFTSERRAWEALRAEWPLVRLVRDDQVATAWSRRVFEARVRAGSLRVWVRGTAFQRKVWRALLSIPRGRTASYRELAERAGYPRAVRAVGTAVGANPVAYLLPCHRVVRATGEVGRFSWDPVRKVAMLAREIGATGPQSARNVRRPRCQS